MTATTSTETVERLPIGAIVPTRPTARPDPDPQFVASVRTHGVIQPLLVTSRGETIYGSASNDDRPAGLTAASNVLTPGAVRGHST